MKATSIFFCRVVFAIVTALLLGFFLLLLSFDLRWSLGLCALFLALIGLTPIFGPRTVFCLGLAASLLGLSVTGLYAWHVPRTDPSCVGFPCATLLYFAVWWLLTVSRLRSSHDPTDPTTIA